MFKFDWSSLETTGLGRSVNDASPVKRPRPRISVVLPADNNISLSIVHFIFVDQVALRLLCAAGSSVFSQSSHEDLGAVTILNVIVKETEKLLLCLRLP